MNTVKRWRDTASELAHFEKSISSAGKYGKIHTKAWLLPQETLPDLPIITFHSLTPVPLEHFGLKTPSF